MMKSVSIDLNESYPEPPYGEPMKDRKHYPTLHVSGKEELDLPDSGTLMVKFLKIRSEESKDDRGERYSCTLEIHSIEGIGADKKPSKRPDEELEERMSEFEKSKED